MTVPRFFSAAAVILTALVLAMIIMVADAPSRMPRPAPAPDHSLPVIPIDGREGHPPNTRPVKCQPLDVRNPDGNYIVPGVRGAIVYRRDRGTELSLDAYVQPGGDGPRPGVVVVHGGGWSRGSRAAFTGQFLELLTRAGYNWVAIDYRLGPLADIERVLEDVQAAIVFVQCHARELRIDPARLVLWGEDTGAQLAAVLASYGRTGVKAMVLVGGFYDLRHNAASMPAGSATDLLQRASPIERVRREAAVRNTGGAVLERRAIARGMPAALVVHGAADSESPLADAKRYCTELRKVRVACDLIEVEGASHRAENWWPSQWSYKARAIEWLSRRLSFTAPAPAGPSPAGLSSAASAPAPSNGPPESAQERESALVAGLHKDIVYSPANGLKLDAYIPSVQPGPTGASGGTGEAGGTGARRPFPAVIIVHGGGWEAGDTVTYVTPLFEPLAKAGFAWFSIDYRLTPDVLHPAQLDDLRDAIRFVRVNAAHFNIDPNRLALLGESASGQMVMQVAASNAGYETTAANTSNTANAASAAGAADTAVAAVVSFYGVYDFEPMVEENASPPRSLLWRLFHLPALDVRARGVLRAHSPIHHVRRGMPPVLLIHGTNERLWAQGQSMSRVLTDRGVPHELVALEGAPHGLENWEGHASWMHYKPRLITWLRANLGGE